VGFSDQEPHSDEGQRHVVMPALPGPDLVRVHACFPLAALKAGFNAWYVITGYCYADTLKQERSRIMTRIKGWLSSQGR
jgi:hypothetical protein